MTRIKILYWNGNSIESYKDLIKEVAPQAIGIDLDFVIWCRKYTVIKCNEGLPAAREKEFKNFSHKIIIENVNNFYKIFNYYLKNRGRLWLNLP